MAERPPNDADGADDDGDEPTLLERRDALRLGAATAAVTAGDGAASSRVAAALQREGASFDRRVNAVEDLGADPSGRTPIDEAVDSVDDGTLVEFPAGTYRVTAPIEVGSNSGFVGIGEKASDVQFRPIETAANRWLELVDAAHSVIGGFTVVCEEAGSIGGTVEGTLVVADVAYDSAAPAFAKPDREPHTLEIEWMGEDVTYEFTVDGATTSGDDLTEGRAATFGPSTEGYLTGGLHRFEYRGSLSDLRLSTDARVAVDGAEVNPETVGSTDDVEFFAAAEDAAVTYDLVASHRSGVHGGTLDSGTEGAVTVEEGIEHLSVEGSALVDIAHDY